MNKPPVLLIDDEISKAAFSLLLNRGASKQIPISDLWRLSLQTAIQGACRCSS